MVERPRPRPSTADYRDQIVAHRIQAGWLFALIVLAISAGSWWASSPPEFFDIINHKYVVDLNSASEDELNLLPGVGPKLARDILEYRERKGKFDSIEDLRNIRGIKDGRLRALAPYLEIASVPPSPALPDDDPIEVRK